MSKDSKSDRIKKSTKVSNHIVNIIFSIVLVFCIVSLSLSFMCFAINITSTSNALKNTTDQIINYVSNSPTDKPNSSDDTINNYNQQTIKDTENIVNYLERLKEIESTSVSTNLLSFLYTFLSSVLIGIGTYYMKKNVENTKIIEDSKEQIEKSKEKILEINENISSINDNIINSKLMLYMQNIQILTNNISFICEFDSNPLKVHKDENELYSYKNLIYIYLPKLNENIREMLLYCDGIKSKSNNSKELVNLKHVQKELSNISDYIKSWECDLPLINDDVKKRLCEEIEKILHL